MYKFKCTASSIKPDKNGNVFTPESLKKFEGVEKPILVNYDANNVVGVVTDAVVKDGKLLIEGTLETNISDLFVAPSYISISSYVNPDEDHLVHTEIEVMSYGLVTSHADEDATPIQFIEVN